MNPDERFDFVAIGDITTDAFIRIKEADVTCDINREHCKLCMRFGDKIPYEYVEVVRAVGNSPNAAVSASRLGLRSALIANVGNDVNGKECVDALTQNGVSASFVRTHDGKATNYHYVLWYQEERTILVKHEEYDYALPDMAPPGWIYLSSLGEHSLPYHEHIADYLKSHPETKLAFQPGTFQMKARYEALTELYRRLHIFFCNKDEAQRILGKPEEIDIKKLLEAMRALGPQIMVITDGPKGAYTYDGNDFLFMPPYPDPKPPFERTGAGDAFASTVTAALALGKTLEESLCWGPVNSMSVVQYVGAQKGLLSRELLEQYLLIAPEDYRPVKISKE